MKRQEKEMKEFKMKASFLAHVVNTDDESDQGILYLRLMEDGKAHRYVKLSRPAGSNAKFDIVHFKTMQDAIEDARALARFGTYALQTDSRYTEFDQDTVNLIAGFLDMLGEFDEAA